MPLVRRRAVKCAISCIACREANTSFRRDGDARSGLGRDWRQESVEGARMSLATCASKALETSMVSSSGLWRDQSALQQGVFYEEIEPLGELSSSEW